MLILLEKYIHILWVETDIIAFLTNEPRNWFILYSYLNSNILKRVVLFPSVTSQPFPHDQCFFLYSVLYCLCLKRDEIAALWIWPKISTILVNITQTSAQKFWYWRNFQWKKIKFKLLGFEKMQLMCLRAERVSLAAFFDVDWLMHNLEHNIYFIN